MNDGGDTVDSTTSFRLTDDGLLIGAWAEGLYDDDFALDLVAAFEHIVGCKLRHVILSKRRLMAQRKLNYRMSALLGSLRTEPHAVVVLCALAMQAGATLTPELRQAATEASAALVAQRVPCYYPAARDDLMTALAGYRDGVPWASFRETPLLTVVANSRAAGRIGLVNIPPACFDVLH